MARVNDDRVGLDLHDLVGKVEQRVGVHCRHGRADHFDGPAREGTLQPLLQHASGRSHPSIGETGRRRTALDDDPQAVLRLFFEEVAGVDADAGGVVGIGEESLDDRFVGLQISGDRCRNEQGYLRASAREPQDDLKDREDEEREKQGDDVERSAPPARSRPVCLHHTQPAPLFLVAARNLRGRRHLLQRGIPAGANIAGRTGCWSFFRTCGRFSGYARSCGSCLSSSCSSCSAVW